MTEWFEGRSADEEQMEKCYWRRVGFVIFLAVVAGLILIPLNAHAEPIYRASTADGVVITLHKEKCQIKEVSNAPFRATWLEKGKEFEGCWRPGNSENVVFYFLGDKTVFDIPAQHFRQVTGV